MNWWMYYCFGVLVLAGHGFVSVLCANLADGSRANWVALWVSWIFWPLYIVYCAIGLVSILFLPKSGKEAVYRVARGEGQIVSADLGEFPCQTCGLWPCTDVQEKDLHPRKIAWCGEWKEKETGR